MPTRRPRQRRRHPLQKCPAPPCCPLSSRAEAVSVILTSSQAEAFSVILASSSQDINAVIIAKLVAKMAKPSAHPSGLILQAGARA
eukprot:1161760-Pelagomonas_calceolata.AAC.2